jgi:23S rRNA (pseudouridine1915-N3)-methyltransferase
MILQFLFVGGDKEPWLREFEAEYVKKLSRFYKIEVVRMKPSKDDRGQSTVKRKSESQLFLDRVKTSDYVVVFDERGEVFTSTQFSKKMERWLGAGRARIVFCVGGAFGFDDEMRSRADQVVSLSSFVLNHHLAQAVVMEQVYRAISIQKNLPYHNEG